jgi:hypothetical protein
MFKPLNPPYLIERQVQPFQLREVTEVGDFLDEVIVQTQLDEVLEPHQVLNAADALEREL